MACCMLVGRDRDDVTFITSPLLASVGLIQVQQADSQGSRQGLNLCDSSGRPQGSLLQCVAQCIGKSSGSALKVECCIVDV